MGPSLVRPAQCSLFSGSFISDFISTFHERLGGLVVTPPVRRWPRVEADDRVNRLQPSLASDRHKPSPECEWERRGRYQGSHCLLDIPNSQSALCCHCRKVQWGTVMAPRVAQCCPLFWHVSCPPPGPVSRGQWLSNRDVELFQNCKLPALDNGRWVMVYVVTGQPGPCPDDFISASVPGIAICVSIHPVSLYLCVLYGRIKIPDEAVPRQLWSSPGGMSLTSRCGAWPGCGGHWPPAKWRWVILL